MRSTLANFCFFFLCLFLLYTDIFGYTSDKKLSVSVKKNKLLAAMLIITGCPEASLADGDGRGVFVKTLKEGLDSDLTEIAMTAHQCLRTLISLPDKKSSSPALLGLGRSTVSTLVPHVVTHALSFKFSNENIEKDKARAGLLEEDIKTLITLPNCVPEEQSKISIAVTICDIKLTKKNYYWHFFYRTTDSECNIAYTCGNVGHTAI
ncbi:hypothetical protein J3Q64DRAFT_1765530 [Phycomyces blakesleeanus]|uniref:Uncharacterized protein n=1 Tax=Phycomyces blakesleeanus TaxID=4837 RepID=A0ABR3APB8_PHYBL